MLTADDGRTDGRLTDYIDEPEKWRRYDPDLFDSLERSLKTREIRNVREAETIVIIPSATFFTKLLTDNRNDRQQYFDDVLDKLADVELIFFDPDNGIEVKSVPYGRKNSSKYLYWSELTRTFKGGHSVLVYQHFPHEKRDPFIVRIRNEIRSHIDPSEIFVFRTSNVVFFLLSQSKHLTQFREKARLVERTWETISNFGDVLD